MTDRGGSGRAEDPPGLGGLGSDWEVGLRRLPFFTQRTAVLLLGVLVALVGWPGAGGPTKLVPGERAGQTPVSRPGAGEAAAPGARAPGAGDRSGATPVARR